jgi:hypothetical protein
MSFRRVVLLLFSVLPLVHAQQNVGSISGTVTDSSGAAVPNAAITITNTDTNLVRKTNADGDGNYAAPSLPLGHYSVRAEAPAFKAAAQQGIMLNVNDALTISFKLEVGDVTQTITVESAPLQVELQNGAAQATTISGTQIRELALITRNYEQLVGLMPGVTSASVDQLYVGVSLPSGQTATIPFSINGARNSSSAWLVDGADNIDRGSNQTLLTTPSVDAISEFKVQRSGYSADSGGHQIRYLQFPRRRLRVRQEQRVCGEQFLQQRDEAESGPGRYRAGSAPALQQLRMDARRTDLHSASLQHE